MFTLIKVTRQGSAHSPFRLGDYVFGRSGTMSLLLNHSQTWNKPLMGCTEVTPRSVMSSRSRAIHYIEDVSIIGVKRSVVTKEVFSRVTDKGKLIENNGYYSHPRYS